jgi:hypothetical protein
MAAPTSALTAAHAAAQRRLGLLPPGTPAPPWSTVRWFNHDGTLQPGALRGRVLVLHAFQMLCPGCVRHALPQAERLRDAFAPEDVVLVGLHTVFEHHAVTAPPALAAFIHENRIRYPVGVDAPAEAPDDPVPQTMRRYGFKGTPSLVLIDRRGHLRRQGFGPEPDVALGAAIAALVMEGG